VIIFKGLKINGYLLKTSKGKIGFPVAELGGIISNIADIVGAISVMSIDS
jgi:hypothetical protein